MVSLIREKGDLVIVDDEVSRTSWVVKHEPLSIPLANQFDGIDARRCYDLQQ